MQHCLLTDGEELSFCAVHSKLEHVPTVRLKKERQSSHIRLTSGANSDTIQYMTSMEKLLIRMRNEPANVSFNDLKKVCQIYFGKPRQDGSSHAIFKTPWLGDPRVNIQNAKGKAKPYQVKQVPQAINKLEGKS